LALEFPHVFPQVIHLDELLTEQDGLAMNTGFE
jgi:hypothetical protein